jgi:hypothetical protein
MKIPVCHPDRKYKAKGKCLECYKRDYYDSTYKYLRYNKEAPQNNSEKRMCSNCNKEKHSKEFLLNKTYCILCFREKRNKQLERAKLYKRTDCRHSEHQNNCRFCYHKQLKEDRKLKAEVRKVESNQDKTVGIHRRERQERTIIARLEAELLKLVRKLEKQKLYENDLFIVNEKLQAKVERLIEENKKLKNQIKEAKTLMNSQNAFAGHSRL